MALAATALVLACRAQPSTLGATTGGAASGGAAGTGSAGTAGVAGQGGASDGGTSGGAGASGWAGASGAGGDGGHGAAGGAPSTCGDGKKTGIEACDGADLGGATCATVIAKGSTGTLACSADCMQFDSTACSGTICSMLGAQPGAPWPMEGRCAARTGRSPFVGPQTPAIRWSLPIPVGRVVVGADTIYAVGGATIDAPTLFAITLDGTVKWSFVADVPGGASSPAIGADGTVYFQVHVANGVEDTEAVYAVGPGGNMKWVFKAKSAGLPTAPAVGPDGSIYLVLAGALHALTPDGTESWQAAGKSGGGTGGFGPTQPPELSSPAVAATGSVYVESTDGNLYALHPDGSKAWTFQVTAGPVGMFPQVVVASDDTVFTGFSDTNPLSGKAALLAIRPDGSQKWALSTCCGYVPTAAIGAEGTAYFVLPDHQGTQTLYAVTADGASIWSLAFAGTVPAPIVIGADGTLYLSTDATLRAVTADGKALWSLAGVGSPVLGADRTLYAPGNGALHAIGP